MQVHPVAFGSAGTRYSEVISEGPAGFVADYYALKLTSVYQPIFSFAHRRPVGYEALLRGRLPDDAEILPNKIFSVIRGREDMIALDLLARELHLRNFVAQCPPHSWLFINVSPEVFVNAPRHAELATSLSVRNSRQFSWLEWDGKEMAGKFINAPARELIPEKITEQLIVELYSK